jgi:hypothetical protein
MTDFRALCVELTDCLEKADWPHRYKVVFQQWTDIARAALAETDGPAVSVDREPASVTTDPSDEELESFLVDVAAQNGDIYWADPRVLARAVLARWGRLALQPIPVSERLPEAGDCDVEGRCWIHMPDMGTAPSWRLVDPREIGPYHTHWLPCHALPLPAAP